MITTFLTRNNHILKYKTDQKQSGVALLTILLMVALATILATAMIKKQQRLVKETSVLLGQGQAFEYAKAGEIALKARFIDDEKVNPKTDSLSDILFLPMPAFKVEDGTAISGQLIDLSGKFNLNNLVKDDGTHNDDAINYFKRLLQLHGQDPALASTLVDWIDTDDSVTANGEGAENAYYQSLNPPYRIANQRLSQVDEVLQVRGFNREVLNAIINDVIVAPKQSLININTASASVLAALDTVVQTGDVQQFLVEQKAKQKAMQSVGELWTSSAFSGVPAAKRSGLEVLLDVKSIYYACHVTVQLEDKTHHLNSVVIRTGATADVLSRQMW